MKENETTKNSFEHRKEKAIYDMKKIRDEHVEFYNKMIDRVDKAKDDRELMEVFLKGKEELDEDVSNILNDLGLGENG